MVLSKTYCLHFMQNLQMKLTFSLSPPLDSGNALACEVETRYSLISQFFRDTDDFSPLSLRPRREGTAAPLLQLANDCLSRIQLEQGNWTPCFVEQMQ
jgi:hypothetical protein